MDLNVNQLPALVTQVFWVLHGQETVVGTIPRHPSLVCVRDVKSLWTGPNCLFLFKTADIVGSQIFHWTLVIDDNSPVPWIESPDGYFVISKLKIIEKPTSTITYCLEGRNDVQKVHVNIPASQITLAEVKNRFPGVGGVFLFKTSDTVSHHWSVIVDNWAQVPEVGDGEIFVQIKMKNKKVTVVELYEDNNMEPSYFRLTKAPNDVTLQDIRAWYGSSGLFFIKTRETTGHSWTFFPHEDSRVPLWTADTIICKVKPKQNLKPQTS